MRYRLLGRTGLTVSELCLGPITYGGQGFRKVMGGLHQGATTVLVKQSIYAGATLLVLPAATFNRLALCGEAKCSLAYQLDAPKRKKSAEKNQRRN
jgi:hypothetical protein